MKSKNHLSYPYVWNLDLQEKFSSGGLKGLCVCESNVTGSASGVGFFFPLYQCVSCYRNTMRNLRHQTSKDLFRSSEINYPVLS